MKLKLLTLGLFCCLSAIHAEETKSGKIDNSSLRQFKLEDVKTNSLKLSKNTISMYKLNILIKYGMLDELELLTIPPFVQ